MLGGTAIDKANTAIGCVAAVLYVGLNLLDISTYNFAIFVIYFVYTIAMGSYCLAQRGRNTIDLIRIVGGFIGLCIAMYYFHYR